MKDNHPPGTKNHGLKNSAGQTTRRELGTYACQGRTFSSDERAALERYEDVLRKGLSTFFEVGNALLAIREARLYRHACATFEQYCHERWGMGRTYAWRVIGAAERLKLLPPVGELQRPCNEFQMRPFLRLEPEAFPGAWQQVVARAKDGKITSELIQVLITEISSNGKKQSSRVDTLKRSKFSKNCLPGQIVALLQDAKRRIEKHELDQAIATIERIDALLFAP